MIITQQIEKKDYEKIFQNIGNNPLADPRWIEAFGSRRNTPVYFEFELKNKIIGIAGGIKIQSSHALARQITKELYLFTGPIVEYEPDRMVSQCVSSLIEHSKKSGFINLKMGFYGCLPELNVVTNGFEKVTRSEFIVDISGEIEEFRKKVIWQKQRNIINKAERSDLEFQVRNDREGLENLINCLEGTRDRKISKGYQEYAYFYVPYTNKEVLVNLLKNGIASILECKRNNVVLSSNFTLVSGEHAHYLLAGSTREGYNVGAPSLLLWKQILCLKEKGVKRFNLGGLPGDESNSGLERFKRSFGGEQKTCHGGKARYLQGPVKNYLNRLYVTIEKRVSDGKRKEI
jgi:hypothetical protein